MTVDICTTCAVKLSQHLLPKVATGLRINCRFARTNKSVVYAGHEDMVGQVRLARCRIGSSTGYSLTIVAIIMTCNGPMAMLSYDVTIVAINL